MPKGMFTQGMCVLLEQPVPLDAIEAALSDYEFRAKKESTSSWEFGGPTVVVNYREEVNGLVAIDIVDQPWPDHMGDDQTETTLFAAWSMGNFGPFAWPGGLERAGQQSWTWEGGKTIAEQHRAFIRIRVSYAFGAEENDPVVPADYDSLPELQFITKLASSLLALPGALCYFNPSGEVLRDEDGLRESLNFSWNNDLPPLDVWSNMRLFNIDPEWSLMDTVGNSQLDIRDAEACFHAESYSFGAVDNFLRNVSLYIVRNGEVIKDGDTMDGPGDVAWKCQLLDAGACAPPRPVYRWFPQDNRTPPAEFAGGDQS